MNSNKTYLPALVAAVFASGALAQTAPAAPPKAMHGAELQKRWAEADLDKDGFLSKAEAQVAGLRRLVENFDALDTNKDGKLSQDEARAGAQPPRGAGAKPPADGKPSSNAAALAGGYKSPDERRTEMQERFKKADTNGDGALSKAEVQAAGNTRMLEHFDAIDANKDGKITPEELRAFWQQRQGAPRK